MESVEDIPADEHPRRPRRGTGRPTASTSRAIDAHAQGRQRRRHGRALRGAPLRDGRTRPRRGAGDRRRHRGDVRPRRRGDRRRRARLLDLAHAAAPCARRPARARHVGRRPTSCSRSPTCSAGTARACSRSRRASSAPGDDYEGTRAEVALDGRDQPAHRPAGDVRPRPEQRRPELYRTILEFVDEEAARGGELRPQTTARGIGLLFGMQHRTFFDRAPGVAGAAAARRSTERLAALDDAARRAELDRGGRREHARRSTGDGVYVLDAPTRVDYSADPDDSLAAHAGRAGETIAEAFVRISRETGGRALFNFPFLNQRMDAVEEMLDHPRDGDRPRRLRRARRADHGRVAARPGSCSHWVRDRGKYHDRGGDPPPDVRHRRRSSASPTAACSTPGAFADVNVIDLDALALPLPEYVHDFPAGRRSLRAAARRVSRDARERRGVHGERRADRQSRRA